MRSEPNPTLRRLVTDVSEGIRVLHSRDGVALSEGQILERARNIVMGLVGNYRIESLDGGLPEAAANGNARFEPDHSVDGVASLPLALASG